MRTRKGAVPLVTLLMIVVLGAIAWSTYNKVLSDFRTITEPIIVSQSEKHGIAVGDKLSDVVLNMPLIPGHPLTVIEFGKVVSDPIADAYYWGKSGATVIEDASSVKLKDIIETGPEHTLIAFNKADCPFCAVLLPYYRDLQAQYGDTLQVVMVYESIQNTEEAAKLVAKLSEKKMGRPMLNDYRTMKFLSIEPHIAAMFDQELNIDHVPKVIWVNKEAVVTDLPDESDFLEYFRKVDGYQEQPHESNNSENNL